MLELDEQLPFAPPLPYQLRRLYEIHIGLVIVDADVDPLAITVIVQDWRDRSAASTRFAVDQPVLPISGRIRRVARRIRQRLTLVWHDLLQ